jgi:hypothetical protein
VAGIREDFRCTTASSAFGERLLSQIRWMVHARGKCRTSVAALIGRAIFVFFAVRFCGIDCGALGQ